MSYFFNGNTINTGSLSNTLTTFGSPSFSSAFTSVAGLSSVFFNNSNKASSMSSNYYIASASCNFPMTISVWIYTDLSYYMTVLGLRYTGSYGIQLDIDTSGLIYGNFGSGILYSAASALQANTWTHIALSISSTSSASHFASMYVNGMLQNSLTINYQLVGQPTLYIGGSGYTDRGYHGYMQSLHMYNRALQSSEISTLIRGQLVL